MGKLMHDFNCTHADEMNFGLLAECTKYLKENPEGVNEMCKVMEEMRDEYLEEGRKKGREEGIKEGIREEREKIVLRMIEDGTIPLERIVTISGLSLEKVKELQMEANV